MTLLRSRGPDSGVESTPVKKPADPVRPSVECCASSGIARDWFQHLVEHDSATILTKGLPFAETRPMTAKAVAATKRVLSISGADVLRRLDVRAR